MNPIRSTWASDQRIEFRKVKSSLNFSRMEISNFICTVKMLDAMSFVKVGIFFYTTEIIIWVDDYFRPTLIVEDGQENKTVVKLFYFTVLYDCNGDQISCHVTGLYGHSFTPRD